MTHKGQLPWCLILVPPSHSYVRPFCYHTPNCSCPDNICINDFTFSAVYNSGFREARRHRSQAQVPAEVTPDTLLHCLLWSMTWRNCYHHTHIHITPTILPKQQLKVGSKCYYIVAEIHGFDVGFSWGGELNHEGMTRHKNHSNSYWPLELVFVFSFSRLSTSNCRKYICIPILRRMFPYFILFMEIQVIDWSMEK